MKYLAWSVCIYAFVWSLNCHCPFVNLKIIFCGKSQTPLNTLLISSIPNYAHCVIDNTIVIFKHLLLRSLSNPILNNSIFIFLQCL